MGEIIPATFGKPDPSDLSAMAMERAAHVLAIRAIDDAYARTVEERAAALEEVCQYVVATAIALPSLPVGVLEDCRSTGANLPAFIARVVKLLRPMGGAQ